MSHSWVGGRERGKFLSSFTEYCGKCEIEFCKWGDSWSNERDISMWMTSYMSLNLNYWRGHSMAF